jgi:outer membrane protein assembly factor BamB
MDALPSRESRSLGTLLLPLILVLAGCARAPASEPSTTFAVKPQAKTPRVAFLWRDQVTSWDYLGSTPKEFASPSHVGPTDELVVTTSEGEVMKVQAANGSVRWRRRLGGEFHGGATIGVNQAFVVDLEGHLRALDLGTGDENWQVQLDQSVESRGAYSAGRLFLSDSADVLRAFDARTGEQLWAYSRETPEYFTVKGSCIPVVDNDAVYCGFSDGHLAAVQIDTGDELWSVDLTGGNLDFVDVDGAVLLVGPRIYAASYSGGVYALERRSGRIIWRREMESVSDLIRSGDRLFVASAIGRVAALDLESGEPEWGFEMTESLPGALAAFGPYVMAFATNGPMYVLDAATGYPHLKWRGTSGFGAPVESGSSRLYGLTNGGQLFGFKLGY